MKNIISQQPWTDAILSLNHEACTPAWIKHMEAVQFASKAPYKEAVSMAAVSIEVDDDGCDQQVNFEEELKLALCLTAVEQRVIMAQEALEGALKKAKEVNEIKVDRPMTYRTSIEKITKASNMLEEALDEIVKQQETSAERAIEGIGFLDFLMQMSKDSADRRVRQRQSPPSTWSLRKAAKQNEHVCPWPWHCHHLLNIKSLVEHHVWTKRPRWSAIRFADFLTCSQQAGSKPVAAAIHSICTVTATTQHNIISQDFMFSLPSAHIPRQLQWLGCAWRCRPCAPNPALCDEACCWIHLKTKYMFFAIENCHSRRRRSHPASGLESPSSRIFLHLKFGKQNDTIRKAPHSHT